MRSESRLSLLVKGTFLIALIAIPSSLPGQCSGGTNLIGSTPTTPGIPAPTAAEYNSGASQWSAMVSVSVCCGNAGNGTCKARIQQTAPPGVGHLQSVSWRFVSFSGTGCVSNIGTTPQPLDGTVREIFRVADGANASSPGLCTGVIEFRADGLTYTSYTPPTSYTRQADLTVLKSNP